MTNSPSQDLADAMRELRMGDPAIALARARAALPMSGDRRPLLALASLAALRSRQPALAIPYLEELLAQDPGDLSSKRNLAHALVETGRTTDAEALVADSDDPALARIHGFILQQNGDSAGAAAAYRRALARAPDDLAALNNLGNVLTARGQFDQGVAAFERAITLAPADLRLYLNLAEALRVADRPRPRLKVLRDAERIAPNDPRVLTELGLALSHNRMPEAAVEPLRRAVAAMPAFGAAHVELGMVYEGLNRTADLRALVESVDAAHAPPEFAFLQAWLARREDRFEDAGRFARSLPETLDPVRRQHLIGAIADRLGKTGDAFEAFTLMNRASAAQAPPLPGPSYRETVEARSALWTREWAGRWSYPAIADDRRDPIFLVGFPRSGTTLLDTMLMALPGLSVLEEQAMLAQAQSAIDTDLAELSAGTIGSLRDGYFTAAQRAGWRPDRWLVDKHPLHMDRVPLIHRLFPRARIIFARRHPCDVVLSCFMANFRMNPAMRSFTSLEETAATYDAVLDAWTRANALFRVDTKTIRYERLVTDPRAELEPLVAWLGLDWSDDLLDHSATARTRGAVRTASYAQIQERLYTRATGRWERYRPQLSPVMETLGPWIERLGYRA